MHQLTWSMPPKFMQNVSLVIGSAMKLLNFKARQYAITNNYYAALMIAIQRSY